ncbi:Exoribonuclease phosphorolytic domain 1 [Penicillium bovifimosum]|uniref:Exoribonuclease phosphorolytic domain 1 n=1 Tax=Penicillium bovifimosum TaxID=126998 RepID=A0A9W9L9M5_9EURO|nr:Exoribonuclease phosphorolytic domain 1 [Penicillium bovifimosum]KAJ5143624.1 Exoribonuclease phosphorolytic domain 1 [Penicillium bovifimosum]
MRPAHPKEAAQKPTNFIEPARPQPSMSSREEPLSIPERDFILEALGQNLRLDGRQFDEYRPLNISFGEEYGHVKLQLGKTSIIVRISAEITKPFEDRPFDGSFNINMELSNMGSPAWENGRSNDLEPYVLEALDRIIRHSNALDTESLCILKGVSCWAIRADIHVIDFDGNITDAACIGVMAGLQHFRRPDSVVKDGRVIVYGLEQRVPCFNDSKQVIVDATRKEEQAAEGDLVIGINSAGDVCYISKHAGAPIDAMLIVTKTNLAWEKVKVLNAIVDKALQADLSKRADFGMADESRAANDRLIQPE